MQEILVAAGRELSAAALSVSPCAADLARDVRRYRQAVTGARADPATAEDVELREDKKKTPQER